MALMALELQGSFLQWRLHGQGLAQLMALRRNGLWLIPESRKTIRGGHDAWGRKSQDICPVTMKGGDL